MQPHMATHDPRRFYHIWPPLDVRAGVTTGDDRDTDTDEEDAANSEMEIKHSIPAFRDDPRPPRRPRR